VTRPQIICQEIWLNFWGKGTDFSFFSSSQIGAGAHMHPVNHVY